MTRTQNKLSELLTGLSTIHNSIVNDVPQLKRGKVWCTICGKSMKITATGCLRSGWPKCCGYTMTIDSPKERKKLKNDQKGKKVCS